MTAWGDPGMAPHPLSVRRARNDSRPVFLLAVAITTLLLAPAADAAEAGLLRLRDVSLQVDVAHPLDDMTPADLVALLGDALRHVEPPIRVVDGATDRILLTVAVTAVSATTLRGFWLPFSGTYAIGTVQLSVARLVTLAGAARPIPAVVWQTQRPVGAPWRTPGPEIARLLEEMVVELAEARR